MKRLNIFPLEEIVISNPFGFSACGRIDAFNVIEQEILANFDGESLILHRTNVRVVPFFPIVRFVNPSAAENVRVEDLLIHLDLSLILPKVLEKYEEDWRDRHPPDAMVRALIYLKLKRYKFTKELYADIDTIPDLYLKLGFKKKPGYSTLCHFINKRLGEEGIAELVDAFIQAVKNELKKHGISCEEVGVDSTPYQASRWDKEARFNPHYMLKMYKLHKLMDMPTGLTISKAVSGGVDYDGDYLQILLDQAIALGFNIKELWGDNHYASMESFAILYGVYGIKGVLKLRKDEWIKDNGTKEEIKRNYHSFWKDAAFKVGATLEDMTVFLISKGEELIGEGKKLGKGKDGKKIIRKGQRIIEPVGNYFKNQMLHEYIIDPRGFLDKYNKRSRIEGNNGVQKRKSQLENAEGKGLKKVTQQINMYLIAEYALALVRLQHGITTNLIGREGLI